jgi:hypothetical protein
MMNIHLQHHLAKTFLGIFPVVRICWALLIAFAICSILWASKATRRSSARLWVAANLFNNFSFACDHMCSTFTCNHTT